MLAAAGRKQFCTSNARRSYRSAKSADDLDGVEDLNLEVQGANVSTVATLLVANVSSQPFETLLIGIGRDRMAFAVIQQSDSHRLIQQH